MVAHRHSASPRDARPHRLGAPASADDRADPARLAREIHVRPGIGVSAHVVQGGGLKMLRMQVDQSALIFVDRGIKTVKAAQGEPVRAVPGQAILVRANQTVDFFNAIPDGTHFEARWLMFAGDLASDAYYVDRASRMEPAPCRPGSLALIPRVRDGLADAFTRARQALASGDALPDAVARQRVLEVLHWLLEDGVVVRSVPSESSTSRQVRSLIGASLDAQWTADRICHELAVSQATLRRRLGTEGTTLTTLLVDARMSTALTLLQATARPVSDIAFAVGYESPSRFAIRFRQRFGFAPTDVRGRGRSALPA